MKYIEHDRQNCSVRTMNEADILLHYGCNVVNVVRQDGSVHLTNAIDIYTDDCYSLWAKTAFEGVSNEVQSVRQTTKRL